MKLLVTSPFSGYYPPMVAEFPDRRARLLVRLHKAVPYAEHLAVAQPAPASEPPHRRRGRPPKQATQVPPPPLIAQPEPEPVPEPSPAPEPSPPKSEPDIPLDNSAADVRRALEARAKALEVWFDDQMSDNELRSRIASALRAKYQRRDMRAEE